MFDKTKPRYITRGIAEELPMELTGLFWDMIDLAAKETELDYLQVFSLEVLEEETPVLKVTHTQEVRPFTKIVFFPINRGSQIPRRKLFVIDDETHQTMLWADEY